MRQFNEINITTYLFLSFYSRARFFVLSLAPILCLVYCDISPPSYTSPIVAENRVQASYWSWFAVGFKLWPQSTAIPKSLIIFQLIAWQFQSLPLLQSPIECTVTVCCSSISIYIFLITLRRNSFTLFWSPCAKTQWLLYNLLSILHNYFWNKVSFTG